ncbi:MAG: AraC family transcriptional regulator [Hyphomonadaceae bacterium]|nr:AraC family transcriptional regulator [Hyphomonadaceae bacterium]
MGSYSACWGTKMLESNAFATSLGAKAVHEGAELGWERFSAYGLKYPPCHDGRVIPAVSGHYFIEVMTGQQRVQIDFDDGRWIEDTWARGDFSVFPLGDDTYWRWPDALETTVFLLPVGWVSEIFGQTVAPGAILETIRRANDPEVSRLFLMLDHELKAGGPHGPLFAESLVTAALSAIAKKYSRVHDLDTASAIPGGAISAAIAFLEANLCRQITLADIAAAADLHEAALLPAFKRALGVTPYQFVVQRRLSRARELLARSRLPLAEVALEVGYGNQSHFSSAFKKAFGVTPSAYRRASQ